MLRPKKVEKEFSLLYLLSKVFIFRWIMFQSSEHFWYQEKITKYLITIIVAQTFNSIPVKLLERIKQGKCPRVNLTFYGVWEFWTKLSPKKSLWAKLLLISKINQWQYLHRSRFTICFAFNYERLVIFIWPRFDLKKQFICRRLLYNLWRTLNWKERGLNKLLDRWLNSQSFDKPLYKLEHVLNINVVYFGIML